MRGLSTSGLFPEHTTERTVREFVNEILLGILFWWMNHYLNDLPRMIPRMIEDLTNMAAVSLFWNTNMAAVTSCENAL